MAEEVKICSACNMPFYKGCRAEKGGSPSIVTKVTEDGAQLTASCPNMKVIRIRRYLNDIDPGMTKVAHNTNSPLFQPDGDDWTKKDLFIRATDWNVFLSNLKWVAGYKVKHHMFIRVVTDLHLVNVYVGNTSIRARLKSQQLEDGPLQICNSLPDLLESPDLVIIRLGVLTHYNKSAANVLQESLLIRSQMAKPTWLVEPPHKAFEPYSRTEFGSAVGMPSCNDDVLSYIEANFDQMTNLEGAEGVEAAGQGYEEDEDGEVTLGDEAPSEMGAVVDGLPEEVEEEETEDGISDADLDALIGGSGDKKKKPYKKKGNFGR